MAGVVQVFADEVSREIPYDGVGHSYDADLGLAGEYENEYQQTCRDTQTSYNQYASISTGQEPSQCGEKAHDLEGQCRGCGFYV